MESDISRPRFRLLQDVTGSQTGICDSSVLRRKVSATWGQALHLGCDVKLPEQLAHQQVDWYLWNKERGRHRSVALGKVECYIWHKKRSRLGNYRCS